MAALLRSENLCSRDYIEHWSRVLTQDPAQIAAVIVTECSDWDVWWQRLPLVGDPLNWIVH